MTDTDLLSVLETYYDAAPRPFCTAEAVGPFTLFARTDPTYFTYYARPALGLDTEVTVAQVRAVRERQQELKVPEAIEWVHETTPSLLPAARRAGFRVDLCPLLVLDEVVPTDPPSGYALEVMPSDSRHLSEVIAAVDAGFGGTDQVGTGAVRGRDAAIAEGLSCVVGAFELAHGALGAAVGGGTHNPRADTTELVGISVVPTCRRRGIGAALAAELAAEALRRGVETVFLSAQDDGVARVYERVGFRRVGTACAVG